MIPNLQNFLREFVTYQEMGDNDFIFQPAFHNINIGVKGRKKIAFLTPEYYGWPKNIQISVNELYVMNNFIIFEKFKILINEKNR